MKQLWDPFASENFNNPYPMYDRIREVSPVFKSQSGDFVLTGYDVIKSVLLDAETFRVGNRYEWITRQVQYLETKSENLSGITDAMRSFVVLMNAPEHIIIRKLMVDAWEDHALESIIKKNIDFLLDKVKRDFDLMKEFATPLPVMTMAEIMGMPKEDYARLKKIASQLILCLDMYTSFKTLVTINKAAHQFIDYIDQYLDYREANLSTDLTSRIISLARKRELDLSRKQLTSMFIFLFMAGEETTVNLIGSAALNLITDREKLAQINNDPKKWEHALEEILRFESPVQLVGRIANRNVQVAGIDIPKESTLTLSLGAANRDPAMFHKPDYFDINRNPKNHLAFGAGVHFCLGNWLAKMQWKLAMKELFDRFPNLKLAGKPHWSPTLSIRGLISLPVHH